MAHISATLSTLFLLIFVCSALGFTDSGVPCYLHPAGEDCHYRPKPDSPVCTSPADKVKLIEGVRQVNRTLSSLEQQLIRLGVIPPDNSCSELPSLTNGGIIYSDLNLSPGSTGRYTCNEGYTLDTLFGRKEFTCTEDGIWNGNVTNVPVYCQLTAERCDPPQVLENGNVTFKDEDPANILSGDMITYICDPGTQLKGPQYRYCQRNGNWSGEEPLCEPDSSRRDIISGPHRGVIIGSTVGGVSGIIVAVIVIVIVVYVAVKWGRPAMKRWRKDHTEPGLTVYNESTNTDGASIIGEQYVSFPRSPTKTQADGTKKSKQSRRSAKGELEESTM